DEFNQGTNGAGTASPSGAGLTYTPNAGFTGTDTFTYTIKDTHGGQGSANVTRTVNPNPAPAAVSGQNFEDRDSSGVHDPGEPGLNGWTIYLQDGRTGRRVATQVTQDIDVNNDGVIDPETERGRYAFPGVAAGTYQVSEESQVGWAQTFPGGATELVS